MSSSKLKRSESRPRTSYDAMEAIYTYKPKSRGDMNRPRSRGEPKKMADEADDNSSPPIRKASLKNQAFAQPYPPAGKKATGDSSLESMELSHLAGELSVIVEPQIAAATLSERSSLPSLARRTSQEGCEHQTRSPSPPLVSSPRLDVLAASAPLEFLAPEPSLPSAVDWRIRSHGAARVTDLLGDDKENDPGDSSVSSSPAPEGEMAEAANVLANTLPASWAVSDSSRRVQSAEFTRRPWLDPGELSKLNHPRSQLHAHRALPSDEDETAREAATAKRRPKTSGGDVRKIERRKSVRVSVYTNESPRMELLRSSPYGSSPYQVPPKGPKGRGKKARNKGDTGPVSSEKGKHAREAPIVLQRSSKAPAEEEILELQSALSKKPRYLSPLEDDADLESSPAQLKSPPKSPPRSPTKGVLSRSAPAASTGFAHLRIKLPPQERNTEVGVGRWSTYEPLGSPSDESATISPDGVPSVSLDCLSPTASPPLESSPNAAPPTNEEPPLFFRVRAAAFLIF
jgi:hypothetical protein